MPGEPIVAASDESFLIRLGETVTPETNRRVQAVTEQLLLQAPGWLRNCHPGYVNLLVEFDCLAIDAGEVRRYLLKLLEATTSATPLPAARRLEIAVLYDAEFGPDLAHVAAHHGLTTDEVIRRHTAPDYHVHFLGFCPGFAYLGGLDSGLATPRLASPRIRIPAGSVGIGGEQTGVYPVASPGGWRLIGRTPVRIFDPTIEPAVLLAIGDIIRFRSITRVEFDAWPPAADRGTGG